MYLEVPVDVLDGPAGARPPGRSHAQPPFAPAPAPEAIAAAAELLAGAERPVLWAGGGVERSGAWAELRALAERLRAPGRHDLHGQGRLPGERPARAPARAATTPPTASCSRTRTWCSASAPSSAPRRPRQYELRFSGRLIQIDAAPERIGATYPALAVVGDAAAALAALVPLVPEREADGEAERRVAELRARIAAGLDAQGRELERGILADIAAAAGPEAVIAWDMTIMGYWAAAHLPVEAPRTLPLPARLRHARLRLARRARRAAPPCRARRMLGVMGDGGVLYALQELASARQHELAAKLLIVDDRGYGILREYQRDAFGETHSVDLVQPDFDVRLPRLRRAGADGRAARARATALDWAFERRGPGRRSSCGRRSRRTSRRHDRLGRAPAAAADRPRPVRAGRRASTS